MKAKTITISKYILKALEIVGLITIAALAPNSLQMLKLFGFDKRQYKPHSVYKALRRMQAQRLVEIREQENKTIISITENGKKRLLKYDFDNMQIEKPKRWDGKWRILAFDIPEKRKRAREALRYKLKELKFYPLQKSLFIYPFPCKDEIDFTAEIFQIQKYIVFFETSNINEGYKIKKYFNLI